MTLNPSSGIVVVDKPAGITSAKLVARLKGLFSARKVGHTGTLDPFATGVMVCCINRATKLAGFFLHSHKAYTATLHLGIETDTLDATGNVLSQKDIQWDPPPIGFSNDHLQHVFKRFEGPMAQLPPIYSALKHGGVPLYKLARQGRPVQKPPRPVEIYKINILDVHLPYIRFDVSCSAGTYIRTLCSDIGNALGCGACLKALRRTESCGFSIDEAHTLPELEDLAGQDKWSEALVTMGDALRQMPYLIATPAVIDKITYGKPLAMADILHQTDIPTKEELIKIIDRNGQLLTIIHLDPVRKCLEYRGVFIHHPQA